MNDLERLENIDKRFKLLDKELKALNRGLDNNIKDSWKMFDDICKRLEKLNNGSN